MPFVQFSGNVVRRGVLRVFLGVILSQWSWAQLLPSAKTQTGAAPPAPQDPLGRSTPRGTVLGFLSAGHKKDYDVASQYLNTRLRGEAAATQAEQLFVVLDRGLPPKLTQLSDKPEGSQKDAADLNSDSVGTISSGDGVVEIVVERVERAKTGPIWLFSKNTLEEVPRLYEEASAVQVEKRVPTFLKDTRIAGIALIEWLGLFVGLPLGYFVTAVLNRSLSAEVGRLLRRVRKNPDLPNPEILPGPLRLLILAAMIRYSLTKVALPLLARQVWTSVAIVIVIAACVWLAIRVTGWFERGIIGRFGSKLLGGAPLLRFARRAIDLLLIFIGIIVALRYFGVNTTAALAGLGVGGIAVALAAQKTLENVIGGLSLIFDQTVRLGDTLKVSDTVGTVVAIGLRSTRIRTLDRTVLSVPNGQIANANLENFSERDKFRFLHVLGLEYETTPQQMRSILNEITSLLQDHAGVERDSVRVRFIRFGASSLDVEIFAHLLSRDWPHFQEVQQELLLRIMEIVQEAGTGIAFPSQTLYFARPADSKTEFHALAAAQDAATSTK
jgi:MscS family membrane protein